MRGEEGWFSAGYSPLFTGNGRRFLINVLSLAGIVFSMRVYDRVIPAQSYPTLYVLSPSACW